MRGQAIQQSQQRPLNGPYGNPIKADGILAQDNPFRFSSKYTESETGLIYYGLRYYAPSLGRWINRDPIGEDGGENLYAFCNNNSIGFLDDLGGTPSQYYGPEGIPPSDSTEYGFVFVLPGGENWAGKGWNGTAKTRPIGMFGLAAKIHDFNYAANMLELKLTPPKDGNERSRRAKSDFIFRKMNEAVKNKLYVMADFWLMMCEQKITLLGRSPFLGESPKEFCPNDGFKNAMTISALDEPEEYLMIPFFELPKEQRPYTIKTEKVKYGRGIIVDVKRRYPNFITPVDYDRNPGWRKWAEKEYGEKWKKLLQIDSSTGPDYVW